MDFVVRLVNKLVVLRAVSGMALPVLALVELVLVPVLVLVDPKEGSRSKRGCAIVPEGGKEGISDEVCG